MQETLELLIHVSYSVQVVLHGIVGRVVVRLVLRHSHVPQNRQQEQYGTVSVHILRHGMEQHGHLQIVQQHTILQQVQRVVDMHVRVDTDGMEVVVQHVILGHPEQIYVHEQCSPHQLHMKHIVILHVLIYEHPAVRVPLLLIFYIVGHHHDQEYVAVLVVRTQNLSTPA